MARLRQAIDHAARTADRRRGRHLPARTPRSWPRTRRARPRPAVAPRRSSATTSSSRYARLVTARAKRIPLQHLTGTAAFGPLDPGGRARRLHSAARDRSPSRMGVAARRCRRARGSSICAPARVRSRWRWRPPGADGPGDRCRHLRRTRWLTPRRNAAGTPSNSAAATSAIRSFSTISTDALISSSPTRRTSRRRRAGTRSGRA